MHPLERLGQSLRPARDQPPDARGSCHLLLPARRLNCGKPHGFRRRSGSRGRSRGQALQGSVVQHQNPVTFGRRSKFLHAARREHPRRGGFTGSWIEPPSLDLATGDLAHVHADRSARWHVGNHRTSVRGACRRKIVKAVELAQALGYHLVFLIRNQSQTRLASGKVRPRCIMPTEPGRSIACCQVVFAGTRDPGRQSPEGIVAQRRDRNRRRGPTSRLAGGFALRRSCARLRNWTRSG